MRQGLRVQLTPLDGWSLDLPASMRDTWFEGLAAPAGAELALHFVMPSLCRPRTQLPNVNYTMFEADRIPADWVIRAAAHERIVGRSQTDVALPASGARGNKECVMSVRPDCGSARSFHVGSCLGAISTHYQTMSALGVHGPRGTW